MHKTPDQIKVAFRCEKIIIKIIYDEDFQFEGDGRSKTEIYLKYLT